MSRCLPRASGGTTPPATAESKESAANRCSSRRLETVKGDYFLDACALCKTQIHESQDRYMYGILQAFCSVGCREDQIALDEISKPPSPTRAPNVSASILALNNKKSRR